MPYYINFSGTPLIVDVHLHMSPYVDIHVRIMYVVNTCACIWHGFQMSSKHFGYFWCKCVLTIYMYMLYMYMNMNMWHCIGLTCFFYAGLCSKSVSGKQSKQGMVRYSKCPQAVDDTLQVSDWDIRDHI